MTLVPQSMRACRPCQPSRSSQGDQCAHQLAVGARTDVQGSERGQHQQNGRYGQSPKSMVSHRRAAIALPPAPSRDACVSRALCGTPCRRLMRHRGEWARLSWGIQVAEGARHRRRSSLARPRRSVRTCGGSHRSGPRDHAQGALLMARSCPDQLDLQPEKVFARTLPAVARLIATGHRVSVEAWFRHASSATDPPLEQERPRGCRVPRARRSRPVDNSQASRRLSERPTR